MTSVMHAPSRCNGDLDEECSFSRREAELYCNQQTTNSLTLEPNSDLHICL